MHQLVHVTRTQAAAINFLQRYHIVLTDDISNALNIINAIGMGDEMLPAAGKVLTKFLCADTSLNIEAEQFEPVRWQRHHARPATALQTFTHERKARGAGFPFGVGKASAIKQHTVSSATTRLAFLVHQKLDDFEQLHRALQILAQDHVLAVDRERRHTGDFRFARDGIRLADFGRNTK